MDIPAAMIDDQLNYVMRDVEYSMMRQGLRMEDYLKYTGQTREQMAQQYRGEAENRVKIQLVLEAIRKAENIEPTAEDIDEQSAKQAKRAGQEVEAFKANLTRRAQGVPVRSGCHPEGVQPDEGWRDRRGQEAGRSGGDCGRNQDRGVIP